MYVKAFARQLSNTDFHTIKEPLMNHLARDLHHRQEHMARELRSLADDAQELLRHTAGDAGSEITKARARLDKGLDAARNRLEAAEQAARHQFGTAARITGDYVHDHPWTTVGAVVGVGLLVGVLLARR